MYKKLSPCPFCNGMAAFVGGDYVSTLYDEVGNICGAEYLHNPVHVECQCCGAVTDEFSGGTDDENYKEAEIAWERRQISLAAPNEKTLWPLVRDSSK